MSGGGLPEPPSGIAESQRSQGHDAYGQDAGSGPPRGGWAPNDIPSAVELLDAVREFLESDVLPATEGRVRFHARVAANVVGMVARELALGPDQAAAHAARLAGLGVHSDAELAAAIRSGALDARADEVRAAVRGSVADKLAVANPGYLRDGSKGDAPESGC
jgi:AcrR family transcriptional regulator